MLCGHQIEAMAAFSVLGLHDGDHVPHTPKYHRLKAFKNAGFQDLITLIRSYLLETFNNKYRKLRYRLCDRRAALTAGQTNALK